MSAPVLSPQQVSRGAGPSENLLLSEVRLARSGPADPVGPFRRETLAEHLARTGPRRRGEAGLADRIDSAGLTGCGGGHVPTALKWRRVSRGVGPLMVVGNGAESEPLSAKDVSLMRQRPHLVLDGLALASEALGAARTVLWLHGDDDGSRRSLAAALDERRAAGLPDPRIELVSGPVHYLAGEQSAIAGALRGGPALPTARGPQSANRARRPGAGESAARTLVQNVETLARVALADRGRPSSGTSLVTVLGPSGRTVAEVDRVSSFADLLRATAAAPDGPPPAVLLGGYGGMWVRWEEIAHRPVDAWALRAAGYQLGAGVVVPLAPESCGLVETAAIVGYLAAMSARQCGPCLFGLPALAGGMRALADGSASARRLTRLRQDVHAVAGRGACHHPDGATRLVASALDVFATDVDAHLRHRPCPASRRSALLPLPATATPGVRR